MLRFLALACLLALAGCSSAPKVAPEAPESATASATAPDGGVLLTSLGLTNAPTGFSVPAQVQVSDLIDQTNQVTVVMTSPDGYVIANYLREQLPLLGYEITADQDNALLFNNGTVYGAFYPEGTLSALTLRLDQEPTG